MREGRGSGPEKRNKKKTHQAAAAKGRQHAGRFEEMNGKKPGDEETAPFVQEENPAVLVPNFCFPVHLA